LGVEALPVGCHGLLFGGRLDALALALVAVNADVVVQQWSQNILDTVLATELSSAAVVDPGALVLAVATLDLFVFAIQYLFLQHLGALPLVDASNLQDLGSVEPAVRASAHDSDPVHFHFVDGDARVNSLGLLACQCDGNVVVVVVVRTVYICGFSMACCWKPFMSEKDRLKPAGAAMSP